MRPHAWNGNSGKAHTPLRRLAEMRRASWGNPGRRSFPADRRDPPRPTRRRCRGATGAASRSSCRAARGREASGCWGPRRPTTRSPGGKKNGNMMTWFTWACYSSFSASAVSKVKVNGNKANKRWSLPMKKKRHRGTDWGSPGRHFHQRRWWMRVCIHSLINIHSRGSLRLFSPVGESAPEVDKKGEAALPSRGEKEILFCFNYFWVKETVIAFSTPHLNFRTGLEVFPLLRGNFALWEIEKLR